MEPWEENDSSKTMEIGNENISNSTIEPGEGSASENSSLADLDISKIKGLKIASLNVNGLMKHIEEIRVMLINYPFEILAISETKIDSTISDSEIHINGYTIIKKDRTKNGGGIAFYIKDTLSYSDRNDLIPD